MRRWHECVYNMNAVDVINFNCNKLTNKIHFVIFIGWKEKRKKENNIRNNKYSK